MESRTVRRLAGVLVVVVTALAGYVVTACRGGQPTVDHVARYHLEVANDAAESARVRVFLSDDSFKDITTDVRIPFGSGSGIMALRSGETRAFEMAAFDLRDSAEDNDLVRAPFRIEFFEENSDAPYKSYDYPLAGCRDVAPGSGCSDDAWVHQRHPDGTEERLFVKSPDRPFYLERDSKDSELARIVITFVPDADAGPVDALN